MKIIHAKHSYKSLDDISISWKENFLQLKVEQIVIISIELIKVIQINL